MSGYRFDLLPSGEKALLFEALLHCIDSNSGIGFRAYNQDDPDYHDGKIGRPYQLGSDSAENNNPYQMLQELSHHLADDNQVTGWRRHFTFTWA